MKLNNKGWGLDTLLICIAVMLGALLVAVINIYRLTNKIDNKTEDTSIQDVINNEEKRLYYDLQVANVETATKKYILDNSKIVEQDGTYTINLETLNEKGYLEETKDYQKDSNCLGYSTIKITNGMYQIEVTLNCPSYN